jgi:3-hydroxyisobutyrate dehydrogenase
MDIGFIGLGNMGFPIACRLIDAGHHVFAFDARSAVVDPAVQRGADRAESAKDVADSVATVMASLPSPQVSTEVAAAIASGSAIRRSSICPPWEVKQHSVITRCWPNTTWPR